MRGCVVTCAIAGGISLGLPAIANLVAHEARFNRPVSLSSTRVMVGDALRDLGNAAGVPLVTDQQLANRPFQLFVRRQTANAVMREVAEFLATPPGRCAWEKVTQDGVQTYRLREDARSRQERLLLLRRLRDRRRRQLETDLGSALHLAKLARDELTQVRGRHPELAYSVRSMRGTLGLLGSLPPERLNQVLTGQALNLPYTQMTQYQRRQLHTMAGQRGMRHTIRPRGRPPIVLHWRAPEDLPRSVLTFRLAGSPDRPGIRVFLPTLPGAGVGWPDALHPPLPDEKAQPEWMRAALEPRRRERETRRRRHQENARQDADLRIKVTLRALRTLPDGKNGRGAVQQPSDLSACLEQIADQARLSVLGDYDHCWDDYYSWQDFSRPGTRTKTILQQDLKDVPVWEALDFLHDRCRVTWEKRGKFIHIRSPRVPYAELDGIDMLEQREPPPPRIPGLDD
jgi:hypothetical protein